MSVFYGAKKTCPDGAKTTSYRQFLFSEQKITDSCIDVAAVGNLRNAEKIRKEDLQFFRIFALFSPRPV